MSQSEETTIPYSMWKAGLLVATQSFLFGFCFSSLNPCLVVGDDGASGCFDGDTSCPKGSIYRDLNLSTGNTDSYLSYRYVIYQILNMLAEVQLATSLTVIGAWIGCLSGSRPSELYGRKFTLLANNIFYIIGSAFTCSGNLVALFLGRFILGLGIGITSVVPPVLLNEIATSDSRGTITTLHQLLVTLAIFTVNIIGFGLVTYVNHGWQYLQGLAIIPAIFMICCYQSIPESPKWLMSQYAADRGSSTTDFSLVQSPLSDDEFAKNNSFRSSDGHINNIFYETAKKQLETIRSEVWDITAEMRELLTSVEADSKMDRNVSWSEVFSYRKAMLIGCGLLFFQAMTGINTVVFYSTTIFGLAGFKESIIGSACWSFVNFIMTLVATKLIDSAGRRILLLRGVSVMVLALVLLAAILLSSAPDLVQGDIAVIAVLIFVCGFAVSLGAVCWSIISEILPTRPRMKAVSLFLSINWGCNLLISELSLTAIDSLGGVHKGQSDDAHQESEKHGVGYLYLIFGIISACALMFIYFLVPETKGNNSLLLNIPPAQIQYDDPLTTPINTMANYEMSSY
jgi:MFS transporter, SP family, galactose:H+ symporter